MTLIVNGQRIEDSQVRAEAERMKGDYEKTFADMEPKARQAQLIEWSRENVIERTLIEQEALKQIEPVPESEIESVIAEMRQQYANDADVPDEFKDENRDKLKKDVALQMCVEKLLEKIRKDVGAPAMEQMRKRYEGNQGAYKTSEEIRISHIVKHVNWMTDDSTAQCIIREAKEQLDKDAAFESLVEKYSDCPERGGDLGYITQGRMVEEFEDVVFNLAAGEVSDIFHTRYGYHIAKLYDRKPARLLAFEDVREQIAGELQNEAQRQRLEEFIDELKNNAQIEDA